MQHALLQTSILSSLILSMLHQMLTDERNDAVRYDVVRALAHLCVYINGAEKFTPVIIHSCIFVH
jgi:hypothetical protein